MSAKIHVERMMHRSSIAVAGDSAASYALIKLIPSGLGSGGPSKPMALNLALVLDVSGSMYEEDGTNIAVLEPTGEQLVADSRVPAAEMIASLDPHGLHGIVMPVEGTSSPGVLCIRHFA